MIERETKRKSKDGKIAAGLAGILILVIIGALVLIYQKKNATHEYYCDKFLLTVDEEQIDLQEIEPDIQSVVELLPITKQEISIICRIDENTNCLLVYSFPKKDFIFQERGTMFAWVQDVYDSTVYLQGNAVYDLENNLIYSVKADQHISVIEYIGSDFYVTVTDENYENAEQIEIPTDKNR